MATLDKSLKLIVVRDVSRKGGSLYITIPSEIVKILGLEFGDSIAFFKDEQTGNIVIDKATPTYVTPSGLSFSISKEQAKKLLKEGK